MSIKDSCSSVWDATTATIASGTSLSGGVNLGGLRLYGIVMPPQWTSANLTFQASIDSGTTWHNLKDPTGNEITVSANANDFVVWLPAAFAAISMIAVRSGTAAMPVSQNVASNLQLVIRSI